MRHTRANKEAAMSRRLQATMLAAALVALIACAPAARAQTSGPDLEPEIRQRAAQIEDKLIAWRRDIHEHPELGEQEVRTAGLVAEHLRRCSASKCGPASPTPAWSRC
jgi:hypothetical protein